MQKQEIVEGARFGRLVVIVETAKDAQARRQWLCRCDCSKETTVRGFALRAGKANSCGCQQGNKTHGLSGSPAHRSWESMKQRCLNPKRDRYPRYGGRGITICERWKKFENFLADMGERPENTTLDRINANGNYEPSNCRWANVRVQSSNRKGVVQLTYDGRTQCLSDWANELGLSRHALQRRLKQGVSLGQIAERQRL